MKRAILFVDDDDNLIRGLQRSLHPLRNEWDMYFSLSGQEALGILEKTQMDVIVTDMRMSGMSGAELLERVMVRPI